MPSKAMELYERIKEDVIRLRFRADEIINEKDLAEQHGVSKTPVREALSMLVQEGYLKKIPRVGYLLRELSEEEYAKLIYLRYTLEKGVVQTRRSTRCGNTARPPTWPIGNLRGSTMISIWPWPGSPATSRCTPACKIPLTG